MMKDKKEIKQLNKNILAKAENIRMDFRIPDAKFDTLKERVVNLFRKNASK